MSASVETLWSRAVSIPERAPQWPARFAVGGEVGRGGSGVVHRAWDRVREEEVALKSLLHVSPMSVLRLHRELRSLSDLRHPGLVRLYELLTRDVAQPFVVMELAAGPSFLDAVQSAGRLDPERLRRHAGELADALDHVHGASRIHRDVKPANVRLRDGGALALLDFELSIDIEDQSEGGFAGSPAYASPEQARGGRLTPASDWYSFGVLLYESLAGRRPFEGSSRAILTRAPDARPAPLEVGGPLRGLADLAMSLLEPDPRRRPSGPDVRSRLALSPTPEVRTHGLLGRDDEVQALLSFTVERHEATRTHVVCASPGMGKSALLTECARRARRAGSIVIEARARPAEHLSTSLIDSFVDSLARALTQVGLLDLPAEVRTLGRRFPALAFVASTDGDVEGPADRESIAHGLRTILDRLGAAAPVLVLLDDIHGADADSSALLEFITGPTTRALCVIGSTRPPCPSRPPSSLERSLRAVANQESSLRPLGDDDASTLIARSFPMVDASVRDAVVAAAAGVPFALLHLGRQATRGAPALDLRAALEQSVQSLGPLAREVLALLALDSGLTPLSVLRRALGRPQRDAIRELEREGLVRDCVGVHGPALETAHQLVLDHAQNSLGAARRRELHRSLAAAWALENDAPPERLARHQAGGGELEGAREHALRAGRSGRALMAFEHGAYWYRRTLELDRDRGAGVDVVVATELGEVLASNGRGREAAQVWLRARRDCDPATRDVLTRRAAEEFMRVGDVDEGLSLFRTLLDADGRAALDEPAWASLLRLVRASGEIARGQRRVDPPARGGRAELLLAAASGLAVVDVVRSSALGAEGVACALREGEGPILARAYAGHAALSAPLGPAGVSVARRSLQRAKEMLVHSDDRRAHAWAAIAEALCAFHCGEFRESAKMLGAVERLLIVELGERGKELGIVQLFRVNALTMLGELEEAADYVESRLTSARRRGDDFTATNLEGGAAVHRWLIVDAPGRAAADLDRAKARWRGRGSVIARLLDLLGRMDVALYLGDAKRAAYFAMASLPGALTSLIEQSDFIRAHAAEHRARALLALASEGGVTQPIALAGAAFAHRRLASIEGGWAKGMAAFVAAGLHHVRLERASAVAQLELARRHFERADMALHRRLVDARRYELQDDREGLDRACAELRSLGLVDVERYRAMHTPGMQVTTLGRIGDHRSSHWA